MKTIKPIKIISKGINHTNARLTSAEMGKLWALYSGNTMSKWVLRYFLHHIHDQEIKTIVQTSLALSEEFIKEITTIFKNDQFPIPIGLTEEDVNLEAPRLFADEFYLHYLKYAGKAGLSIYTAAIPLMTRPDVRDFIIHCTNSTVTLISDLNELLSEKGFLNKPPYIPIPKQVDFVTKQSFLNGFFGNVRPLHALEVSHLHDNIENNVTSKALIMGFAQVAKNNYVRDYFQRGKELTNKHIAICAQHLHHNDLPSQPLLDDLVEASTVPPFSDKLMLFHKIDMFSMKVRSYANALSLNGRRDISGMYAKFLMDVGLYVEDGANIMINEGWMEEPPHAVNRDELP